MILCFSGTGNSAYIAKLLSKYLEDNILDLNNLIKQKNNSNINSNKENIVIVTPTYAWRMPRVVNEYLSKIKINNAKNVYFVMSCGGQIGNAAKYNKLLADKLNLTYKGTIGIRMPDNYIIMFDSETDEDCIATLKKIEGTVKEIANDIKSNTDLKKPRNNLYDRFMTKFINNLFYKFYINKKGFYSSSKCTSCGMCAKVCPLNNIKLVNNKPVWDNNCTHCMKCLSYCPVNAINYKNKTKNKKPYKIEDYIDKL